MNKKVDALVVIPRDQLSAITGGIEIPDGDPVPNPAGAFLFKTYGTLTVALNNMKRAVFGG
jgi:hypothetical protein